MLKKSESRTINSFRNVSISIICQIITLLLSFVTRTIFIKILGSGYLGINGLFSNILSVLSLADLGFGTAVAYSLYKPIADGDQDKTAAIVRFYGKLYAIVASVILGIGLALIPFLNVLVSSEIDIPNIKFYYLLYLFETASSYLFVYKSVILSANQQQYIIKLYRTLLQIVTNFAKLFILLLTHNFTRYLIVQISGAILTNFVLSKRAEKEYPYICKKSVELDSDTKKSIFSNVKSLFLYKLGSVILHNTDNLLISVLVSTTVVGLYSNYGLLFGTVITMSELLFGGFSASVGNLNATSDKDKMYSIFKSLNFANFWVYGFCAICLFCLMDDFVTLWIGSEYVLGTLTSLVISLNVFVPGMLTSISTFRNATGLFRQTKYVYFCTAIINLVLSVALGKVMGLTGIILATSIARILTNVWYEPYILISKFFGQNYFKYVLKLLGFYACFFFSCGSIYLLKKTFISGITIWVFLTEMCLCVIGINIFFMLLYGRSTEMKFLQKRVYGIIKGIIRKKR